MKAFNLIAWIAGIIALIMILLGLLSLIPGVQLLGVNKVVNYFHVANSFLLVAIACLIKVRLMK